MLRRAGRGFGASASSPQSTSLSRCSDSGLHWGVVRDMAAMRNKGDLRVNEVPVVLVVVVKNFLSGLLGALAHEILPIYIVSGSKSEVK